MRLSSSCVVGVGVGLPVGLGLLAASPWRPHLGSWTQMLPHVHALTNALTVGVLLLALYAIRIKKNAMLHRRAVFVAIGLGALFLLSYALYHLSTEPILYGDVDHDGALSSKEKEFRSWTRIYYGTLLSHILLAVPVPYLVLRSAQEALRGDFVAHKRWVHYAYPVWLYVSVSGVVVYLMIRPYY